VVLFVEFKTALPFTEFKALVDTEILGT
jgi:hypothetical protein